MSKGEKVHVLKAGSIGTPTITNYMTMPANEVKLAEHYKNIERAHEELEV